MEISESLDQFDKFILEIVAVEGRIPVTELAKRVGLSKTPCLNRLRRLERSNIITGYRASLNAVALGLDHIAFVEVSLSDTRQAALIEFNDAVQKIPAIEQCHMVAARYDYLLKVRTRSMSEYRRVLGEEITTLPHVSHTSTSVAMEAVKEGALQRA